MKKYLSASIMCADLLNMEKSIRELEKAEIDFLHVDIMDGDFVPNITLGFDLINALKKITDIPLDVHMMVNEPSKFIDMMNLGENDILCVHYESEMHIARTLEKIKNKGIKAGLAINPGTPVESFRYLAELIDMALVMTVNPGFGGQKFIEHSIEKVRELRRLIDATGSQALIEVDGGVNMETGRRLVEAGADVLVAGSTVFKAPDQAGMIHELKSLQR